MVLSQLQRRRITKELIYKVQTEFRDEGKYGKSRSDGETMHEQCGPDDCLYSTRRLQLLCRLKINDPDAGDKALVAWKIKSSASDPRERRVCLIDFLIEVC